MLGWERRRKNSVPFLRREEGAGQEFGFEYMKCILEDRVQMVSRQLDL